MERIDALKPAGGKLADYPFVRRLRNRRLIVYLHLQGFQSAYDRIVHETDLYMCRRRLKQLVACGQWTKALGYIRRFVPPAMGGVEARTLYIFLDTFLAVENAAACSTGAPVTPAVYKHDLTILTTMCAGNTKLSSILHKINHKPQFRASLDWKLVREKASLIAGDLANHSPELRRRLLLPNGPRSPHDLLPIGPRCPRRRRRETTRQPTSTIVKCYLNRKRSLPSSSPVFGLNSEGRNRVVDLIEDCIKAGRLPELHQEHLLHSSAMEDHTPCSTLHGAFSTPFSQTMLGTTGPATSIETSSVTNAGAPTFTDLPNYLWHPSVANSGAFITPFSQTMHGTTAPAKNIETSLLTNAGNPTCTGLPNYLCWYPPVANSSGIPVSQPAEISGFTSATNAGVVDLKLDLAART